MSLKRSRLSSLLDKHEAIDEELIAKEEEKRKKLLAEKKRQGSND